MKQHSFLPPLANRFITVPTRCSFESLTLSPIHILYKYVIQPDPNFLGQYRVFRKNIILNTPSQYRFPTDLCCQIDTRLWKKSPSESLPLPNLTTKSAHSKAHQRKESLFHHFHFPWSQFFPDPFNFTLPPPSPRQRLFSPPVFLPHSLLRC